MATNYCSQLVLELNKGFFYFYYFFYHGINYSVSAHSKRIGNFCKRIGPIHYCVSGSNTATVVSFHPIVLSLLSHFILLSSHCCFISSYCPLIVVPFHPIVLSLLFYFILLSSHCCPISSYCPPIVVSFHPIGLSLLFHFILLSSHCYFISSYCSPIVVGLQLISDISLVLCTNTNWGPTIIHASIVFYVHMFGSTLCCWAHQNLHKCWLCAKHTCNMHAPAKTCR